MQTSKAYKYNPELRVVKRNCYYCGTPITKGRTDKKYCNRNCQNAYNNQLHAAENNNMRRVNYILSKNRRLLSNFIGVKENIKVAKSDLINLGFQFNYHTHTQTNSRKQTYYYCYEFGYLNMDHDQILIVRGN